MAKRRVRLSKYDKLHITHRVVLHTIYAYDLEGSLSDVSRFISELAKYDTGFDDIRLESDMEYGYGGDCGSTVFRVVGFRREIDEECDKCIEELKQQKRAAIEKQEIIDRKMYKMLKEKFGD